MNRPKPDCWKCKYCRQRKDSYAIECHNPFAIVKGNIHAVRLGRFQWPTHFDARDIDECDSFEPKGKQ